ncbi:integration host factor subunit beta [Ralstonia holmesii]|uniref:Integration host factor subunit beta n=1 Tax=Ralstonia holmesii TaxID=3058602 RepID=A0ABC8QEW1_9RALS|nr:MULTISPECIES: integration host factor subunit beta [Ralstonia]CAJ0697642.1 Integration host factor subunit beta [Ralstonia sp. LMG 32967]CAJ0798121.1 Integration host factor subunit beta [Ralstonia sp. LMG 32967]CAJ0807338.1 Integration host factor subunit beta [Ralstonia sp. LMG 32967]
MPMTKSELVEKLAARFPQLLLRDADIAVKTILDAMSDALADGHRIEIRGFGSFGLNRRPPRVGRNPKSGEKVLVPEKRVPHFKAGKELRERVDRSLERQGEPSSEGEPAVSLAAVKAVRQTDSTRQTAGFPVDTVVPLAMSR